MILKDSIRITPSIFKKFNGELLLDSSKSMENRSLLLQFLSSYSFQLKNEGNSDDVASMRAALNATESQIDIGMAGTALRFLTAGFSITPGKRILTGHSRLKERPISPLVDTLRKLGASISYVEKEGFMPLIIEGKELHGNEIEIDQNYSSQFVSALMMIGPFLPNGIVINRIGELKSESYVGLTKCIMLDLGFKVKIDGRVISVENSKAKVDSYSIESDWSAAAYWQAFVALLPNSRVVLKGLNENSCQGDKKMLDVLANFNLSYQWLNGDLHLSNTSKKEIPQKFKFDCSQIPDQAQTLAFLCASQGVEMELSGLETLVFKETNRIEALQNELEKLGLNVQSTDSTLIMSGSIKVEKVTFSSYNDHRMAMAAALVGTRIETVIEDRDVVSKSYPAYWKDLEKLTT